MPLAFILVGSLEILTEVLLAPGNVDFLLMTFFLLCFEYLRQIKGRNRAVLSRPEKFY